MNQKTILTFLPIVFLICMCVFLLGLYYAYTQNKNSDFFNPSNQTCNYSDESLSLSLDYSCDWSVYNDGISYIDKEYNDMLIKDTLHFFKGDNEVLVQVFKVNPTGSYFILNQDYTFEEINDNMIIYKKENYDLYRFAEKFDCNQLEEKRYVTGSSNTVCGKTMFLRNEVTLQIRSDLNNQDISEFIATIVAN